MCTSKITEDWASFVSYRELCLCTPAGIDQTCEMRSPLSEPDRLVTGRGPPLYPLEVPVSQDNSYEKPIIVRQQESCRCRMVIRWERPAWLGWRPSGLEALATCTRVGLSLLPEGDVADSRHAEASVPRSDSEVVLGGVPRRHADTGHPCVSLAAPVGPFQEPYCRVITHPRIWAHGTRAKCLRS